MQKITADDPESQSADIVAENLVQLKALFPEIFIEDKVDFQVLKQLLGDAVDEREEKYGLNWHGKRQARQMALTPSTGTLRPSPEDSVDWDTTQNLMLEGDNLEVLKLLQKSFAGRVKLIYIDPPYNTGKDFVYPDDYRDNIRNYLELTGQIDGDNQKLSSNTEASGRFHTAWLNMMYPRLKIAKSLLRPDGVVCISINDIELANLLRIGDEIYGEENLAGVITWKARVKPVNIGYAKFRPQRETEFLVVYQRNDHEGAFGPLYTGSSRSYPHKIEGRIYRLATILKSNRGTNYRSTMSFEVDEYSPPEGQRWQGGEAEIRRLHNEGYVEYRDGTPFRRYFEDEEGAEHNPLYCFMDDEWSSTSEAGKFELNRLLGNDHGFDTVKPTRLIKTLVASTTALDRRDIVMDFFAGSGTTGEAVMSLNAEDGGNRRAILVQLPEPLDIENKDQRSAAAYCDKLGNQRNIGELTKERLRRSAAKIEDENPACSVDLGFRVFKLDASNICSWDPDRDDLDGTLLASIDHIKPGRSEEDIFYELLLKLGLDLCVPTESRAIAGKAVLSVGAGTLIICLDERIERDDVEPLASGISDWHAELSPAGDSTVVFRDSAFVDDVAKTNLAAILEQRGLGTIRSI